MVSVLVRVMVLVEVMVERSSATAASGSRRAAAKVGRCIFACDESVIVVVVEVLERWNGRPRPKPGSFCLRGL